MRWIYVFKRQEDARERRNLGAEGRSARGRGRSTGRRTRSQEAVLNVWEMQVGRDVSSLRHIADTRVIPYRRLEKLEVHF